MQTPQMTEALSRLIPLLENDVVATLGERYRHMVRLAVQDLYYEGPDYDERIVDAVQEEFIETRIDITWPACPRHGLHPLFHHEDGWWWCEQDRARLCKLGHLSTLPRPSERR